MRISFGFIAALLAIFHSTQGRTIDFEKDLKGIRESFGEDVAWYNGALLNHTFANWNSGDLLLFPKATFYLVGGIIAENVEGINIKISGRLLFSDNPSSWPRNHLGKVLDSLIFINCRNLRIQGDFKYGNPDLDIEHIADHPDLLPAVTEGVLDGNGAHWWHFPFVGYILHLENRPRILRTINCINVLVENLIFLNSPYWTTLFENVTNLEVSHVELINRRTMKDTHTTTDMSALNTDGIDVTGRNVHVHDVTIWTQDDCIAVKDGSENMLFENINASGLGLAIGSIGNSFNRNLTFRNAYLYKTVKAIYFKFRKQDTQERLQQQSCPCEYDQTPFGLIEDVLFENIVIEEAEQYAIWLGPAQQVDLRDPSSCSVTWPLIPGSKCVGQPNGKMKNIKFKDLTIIRPIGIGMLMGTKERPIENLVFENVVVDYNCSGSLPQHHLPSTFKPREGHSSASDEYLFLGLGALFLLFFVPYSVRKSLRSTKSPTKNSTTSWLFSIVVLISAVLMYGVFIHIQIDLLQPEAYHRCEFIKNSTALGSTWPVPHCFEDKTISEPHSAGDISCLHEFDYYHSFFGVRWLEILPTYVLLGFARIIFG